MKGNSELVSIASTITNAGFTRSSVAIVSPCSGCHNYRSLTEGDLSACPRHYWEERARQMDAVADSDPRPADYLLRKARSDDAKGYENPVNWVERHIRLVWVAMLEENQARINPDGSIQNPDLLSAGFDTNYIVCRTVPYIPAVREADYYAGMQLREGDTLLAHSILVPQPDPSNPARPVQLGGLVQKITPFGSFTITPAKLSVNGQGI